MNKDNSAVILARVSSKSQEDEGYSLDSQLKLLHGYCDSKGLEVMQVFRIAETASKEQSRRVFKELIHYLKKHRIRHLTVEKTDRLTRNLRDAVVIDDWLNAHPDRRLHAVKENLLLHKEARSDVKFMWNIHLAVAKKYTDNLREEAMKGWAEKLAQGWLPAPPPPGYMTILDQGKRIHVPNPKTAPIVKQAFDKYLEVSETVQTVADFLRENNVTTRKRKPLTKSAVHRMLTNPFYKGDIFFNQKLYEGAQEPIVTARVFTKVQQKLTGKRTRRTRTHKLALQGFMTCAHCDGVITWQLQKNRYYGSCQRRELACRSAKFLREDDVEQAFMDVLKKLVCPSKEVIEWVIDELSKNKTLVQHEQAATLQALQARRKKLTQMDEMLYEDKLSGDITAQKYQQKHSAFIDELQSIDEQLANIDSDAASTIENRITIVKLTQSAAQEYAECSIERKQEILQRLFESVVVDKQRLTIRVSKLVGYIADSNVKTRTLLHTV